jgi:hypothetical protein
MAMAGARTAEPPTKSAVPTTTAMAVLSITACERLEGAVCSPFSVVVRSSFVEERRLSNFTMISFYNISLNDFQSKLILPATYLV